MTTAPISTRAAPAARRRRPRLPCVPALRRIALAATALLLAACGTPGGLIATVGPDHTPPRARVAERWFAPVPPAATGATADRTSGDATTGTSVVAAATAAAAAGSRPLPHAGSTERLAHWWSALGDPALVALQEAAQRESAGVAQAAARIARARADAVAADAAGVPTLEAIANASRAAFSFGGPATLRTQFQAGLQSGWEIDLFGGQARQREAAVAQLQSSVATWHDARVALAAEVAHTWLNYRACEAQRALAQADAESRARSLQLIEIAGRAGFQAPATVALARAVAAEGASTLTQRIAQCDAMVKAMVALTGLEEPDLRQRLHGDPAHTARIPDPQPHALEAIPAQVLLQRPDLIAAERDVAAASAAIGVQEADRYPRLTLTGSVTPTRMSLGGAPSMSVLTWSVGPALSLPLLDGGRRAANVEAARGQYAAAVSAYQARARAAVREVEDALVRLDAAARRLPDAQTAAQGYTASFEAAQARQRAGLGSLVEAEDARRVALAAQAGVVALRHERAAAWIALYRAAGGGWDAAPAPAAQPQESR